MARVTRCGTARAVLLTHDKKSFTKVSVTEDLKNKYNLFIKFVYFIIHIKPGSTGTIVGYYSNKHYLT